MRIVEMVLAVGLVFSVSACSSTREERELTAAQDTGTMATYRTMSVDELADIIADNGRSYTVVNVHVPYQGEIVGTDANIAFNNVDALVEALPDKNVSIILYCRSGSMSEQAARALVELGYTQVYDVPGGMNAWQSSGRSLVNSQ